MRVTCFKGYLADIEGLSYKIDKYMDMITNLLIEVLGYMAEMEHRIIRVRQKQGIDNARVRGIKFGRKKKVLPETWEQDLKEWKDGKCTAVSLIKKYGWAPATFYSRVHEFNKSNGLFCENDRHFN